MKHVLTHILPGALLACSFISAIAFAGGVQVPAHFDFGPKKSEIKAGFAAVNQRTLYSKQRGFGLLSPADSAFQQPDIKILDELNEDGVAAREAIAFRVDVAPGAYWIELFMAGGKFTQWQGEIRANGRVIESQLHQFRRSSEGNLPPAYWAMLRRVETGGDSLVIRVSARKQVSTLLGVSIFEDEQGALQFRGGRVVMTHKLAAPNAKLALDLINKGRPVEAQSLIAAIPETRFSVEKATLLLALAGRLEIAEPRPITEWAARLLRDALHVGESATAAFNLRLAELYILADNAYKMAGWDWAKQASGESIFGRVNIAGSALDEIAQVVNHPLYHRAIWFLGKVSFWDWVEEHGPWQKAKAEECFTILEQHYPDHRLLRMYMGEQLAFQEDAELELEGAPQWAVTANQALNGLLDVIHYWVDNRQAENGEFGGKYDDDVEMLRWWPIARLAADDDKTLLGLRRLVDGVWNSGWIENGFSKKIRDVEHAAEPVADTQPMMIGLDYGNPIYVERCMQTTRGLGLWTGVNSRGHRHFKSSWYSATELDLRPPRDCDVPMNARTVKAVRWLAWYNRHPVAIQFLRDWADAWLQDCQRTDKGKPYGIVPSAIRFEDDAIGGHADNWPHPGMFWHYYDFSGGNRILREFLSTWALTGDARYLQPVEAALEIVRKYEANEATRAAVGSEAWVAGILSRSRKFAQTVELWRLLTSDSRFDDVLTKVGSDYLKFRLTGDKKYLVTGSERILNGTKYNRELITTEAYFTDRVDIGNIHENRDWASSHLESMYTGNSLLDEFYPFYTISWSGLDADFAAVVLESDPEQLRVLVYNFAEEARAGTLHFWSLVPGKYEFRQGDDQDDDGLLDAESLRDEFIVQGRTASHPLILPARTLQIIEVRQQEGLGPLSVELADLAIVADEIHVIPNAGNSTIEVGVPVHNIGIVAATNFVVELRATVAGEKIVLAQKQVARIEAPLDLQPRIVEVSLQVAASQVQSGPIWIAVDPAQKVDEITEVNNAVSIPDLFTGKVKINQQKG